MRTNMYLYNAEYMKCPYLAGQNENFLGWICPLLKLTYVPIDQYIFYETDLIEEIFFLTVGNAGFVLPFRENIVYIEIQVGDLFGQLDLILSGIQNNMDINSLVD